MSGQSLVLVYRMIWRAKLTRASANGILHPFFRTQSHVEPAECFKGHMSSLFFQSEPLPVSQSMLPKVPKKWRHWKLFQGMPVGNIENTGCLGGWGCSLAVQILGAMKILENLVAVVWKHQSYHLAFGYQKMIILQYIIVCYRHSLKKKPSLTYPLKSYEKKQPIIYIHIS